MQSYKTSGFSSLKEFYPFYLSQHAHPVCKAMHFVGTTLVLCMVMWVLMTGSWTKIWMLPLLGYGFAWVGHFFFEKNKPATFKYPIYSLACDFVMYKDILLGKVKF